MQDAKEEVRARLNIEDVIGEYVQLKRAGRNFKGLSPFSSERTPSFVVSPDKQIWHDFSSGRGGDVFSFVMEAEGMDFREALEHLANKAGVELAQYNSGAGKGFAEKKKRLLQAHALAARYYQQSLLQNAHALEYVVKNRKLTKEIIQNFQIGYAPESGTALTQFLTKKGFTRRELDDAGLLNRFGGDLFRGRMMVPLMDPSGQVIGFTARILKDDPKAPKYLNTPQTLLYDKSRHVFGLSQAKEAIRKNDYVVIVEGNMDVVTSHQVGVTGVVATAGTALTEQHLKALSRLTPHVRLSFDGDKAGLAASERAIPIAQSVGVELTIINLPDDAKDPDELIQQGVERWREAIDAHQPVVDWVLDRYKEQYDISTATGKGSFTTAALAIVAKLDDPVEQEHYVRVIADSIDSSQKAVNQKLQRALQGERMTVEPAKKPVQATGKLTVRPHEVFQDDVLAIAVRDAATHALFGEYPSDMFDGDERRALAAYLAERGGVALDAVPKKLHAYENYVKIVLLKSENRYDDWGSEDRYFAVAKMLRKVKNEYEKRQLDQQIAEAAEAHDEKLMLTLQQRRIQLNKKE